MRELLLFNWLDFGQTGQFIRLKVKLLLLTPGQYVTRKLDANNKMGD